MKRITLLVLLLIVFITPCTFAANGKVYENQDYKFHVTFPSDWQLHDQQGTMIAAHAPAKIPSITLFADPISKHKATIAGQEYEVSDYIANMEKGTPSLVLVERSTVRISNYNATLVVLSDNNIYFYTYFIYTNHSAFCILAASRASTLDNDQQTFSQIISTIKILDE